jgi:CcmD family protein
MDHLGYLFAAYSIIFLLIGLYAIFIGMRQAGLDREVRRLEAALRKIEPLPAPDEGIDELHDATVKDQT